MFIARVALLVAFTLLLGCSDDSSWNNPYPNADQSINTFYTSFSERPKHLDPAKSYSSNEWSVISQIYEPPLQYHYLIRPYKLQSLISKGLPNIISASEDKTIFEIKIKPGILYQPHPAFAKNNGSSNDFLYQNLTYDEALSYKNLADFKKTGSRELVASDFVYQIKRLADSKLNSPIFSFMTKYIYKLDELRDQIKLYRKNNKTKIVDLRKIKFEGAYVVDKYTYRVVINVHYPQFKYWLAMPFFTPIPWEADLFYQQSGFEEHNISLDWYPVGTGPYMLIENNPERRMVMVKNPNFHGEKYPRMGMPEDEKLGLLKDKNSDLPFIDKVIFVLEKESIPYWNKFLQGYYDLSGISSDNFASAIDTSPNGSLDLTSSLKEKGISLISTSSPTTMYWGFNMLDEKVGGYGDKNKKLRRAISIVFDVEEFINIFANGRGIAAHSPIPPGIYGHMVNYNNLVYKESDNKFNRKSIEHAKKLLAEAGYPNGRNEKTGEPLIINFEAISSGDPNEKAIFAWIKKQIAKLDIQLNIRVTDYNRFRDKMNNGTAEMYFWGWNADYPDPENFLFMFYSKNGKVKSGGENASNYANPKYDVLFEKLKSEISETDKNSLILEMINILQEDAPWIWGYHPTSFTLQHKWVVNNKPNAIARNTLKYIKIDSKKRSQFRKEYNKPLYWPFIFILLVLAVIILPAIIGYIKKERYVIKKRNM